MIRGHFSFTTPGDVITVATVLFDVSQTDLCSHCRKRPVLQIRQATMAACRIATNYSIEAIAAAFHHEKSTVRHALRRVEHDPELGELAAAIAAEAAVHHPARSIWRAEMTAESEHPIAEFVEMKPELHVVLGMDPDEYEAALEAGRKMVGWQGMGATRDPRWHSHPLLGVTGHAHKDGRLIHGHLPEIHWGEVVFVELPRFDGPGR